MRRSQRVPSEQVDPLAKSSWQLFDRLHIEAAILLSPAPNFLQSLHRQRVQCLLVLGQELCDTRQCRDGVLSEGVPKDGNDAVSKGRPGKSGS